MNGLVVECEPYAHESAYGYLLRAFALNRSTVREALEHIYGHGRRHIRIDSASAWSQMTGVPRPWFEHRFPRPVECDRGRELELFGQIWRGEWTHRGTHQQVCLACIEETGYARLEWDLMAYTACHVHGTILLDRCGQCGRGISPDRPALEMCSCGNFLDKDTPIADPSVLEWSSLLSAAVCNGETISGNGMGVTALLRGMTVDGAYRVLLAFGGGHSALRGLLLNGVEPWLTSFDLHAAIGTALTRMARLTFMRWGSRTDVQRCADSLAEQKVRGISQFDRAAAGNLLRVLGLPSRWRNKYPEYNEQQDLFI